MIQLQSRLRRLRETRDSGMTLTELIVSMGIFTAVLMVFMAAVVSMSQTTVRAQVTSDAASQLRTVFQRLDKELRYASEINVPGISNGDMYVEYLVPVSTANAEELCVQWRLQPSTQELQRRDWPLDAPDQVSQWSTLVTDVQNDLSDSAQAPFESHLAGPSLDSKVYLQQRLDVYLDTGVSTASSSRGGGQLDVSFVALNSSVNSDTQDGDTVCLSGAVQRP